MFNSNKKVTKSPWVELESPDQLGEIESLSENRDVLIFKHSTRCSISSMALNRLENSSLLQDDSLQCYYLDLLAHRELSNRVSEWSGIRHESPQVLLFSKGRLIYQASHGRIRSEEIQEVRMKGKA